MTTIWQGADDPLLVYEAGKWTPNLVFATPGTTSFVKDAASFGSYTKIGTRIFCDMYLNYPLFTWVGTAGLASITGLPFTSAAGKSAIGMFSLSSAAVLNATYRDLFCLIGSSSAVLLPYFQLSSGYGQFDITSFPSATAVALRASFSYTVDE